MDDSLIIPYHEALTNLQSTQRDGAEPSVSQIQNVIISVNGKFSDSISEYIKSALTNAHIVFFRETRLTKVGNVVTKITGIRFSRNCDSSLQLENRRNYGTCQIAVC